MSKNMKYSLDFLCWVNRCLLPGDFMNELLELGIDPALTMSYVCIIKQGKGILDVYQEYISSEESRKHVEAYLDMMLTKWNKQHTMKTKDYEKVLFNIPNIRPIFRLIRVPNWIGDDHPLVKKNDLFYLHQYGNMIHIKSGSGYGITPSYVTFVGYRNIKNSNNDHDELLKEIEDFYEKTT